MADAVVAFGTNTDERAFTAQTILASVNGWESDVLPDGNRVAITPGMRSPSWARGPTRLHWPS